MVPSFPPEQQYLQTRLLTKKLNKHRFNESVSYILFLKMMRFVECDGFINKMIDMSYFGS